MFIWWASPRSVAILALDVAFACYVATQPIGGKIALTVLQLMLAAMVLNMLYHASPRVANPRFLAFIALLVGLLAASVVKADDLTEAAKLIVLFTMAVIIVIHASAILGICAAPHLAKRSRKGGAPVKSATCLATGTQRYGTDGKVYEVKRVQKTSRWMKA